MNSFQAKIGWKKMRKREIKIIVPFLGCLIENSKTKQQKVKKIPLLPHFMTKQVGRG